MGRATDLGVDCDLDYDEFRTGDTFQSIHDEMWSSSTNSDDWRYRGRSGVLGYWREKKQRLWRAHEHMCDVQENAREREFYNPERDKFAGRDEFPHLPF